MEMIRGEIRDILSGILRLNPEQFDQNRSLVAYGIDSLMAMELRLEVERRFDSDLPALALSREVTGARLAALLLAQIRDEDRGSEERGSEDGSGDERQTGGAGPVGEGPQAA